MREPLVTLLDVLPHGLIRVVASMVFASFASARKTVPEVSVGVAYAQGMWAFDVVRFVFAA